MFITCGFYEKSQCLFNTYTCGFHENTTTLADLVKKTLFNHYGFDAMAMYTVAIWLWIS